jgi:hypothetical protein
LEYRWTPSVTAVGNAINIRGNGGNDTIVVQDNGTNGPGGLLVFENGTQTFKSNGPVGSVNISTFGGADTVVYRQVSPLQLPDLSPGRSINIDLGDGNDLAALNFVSIINSFYFVDVLGGRGNDQILASVSGKIDGQAPRGGVLSLYMNGGEGDDFLDVRSFNNVGPGGSMVVKEVGGAGSDTMYHQFDGILNGYYSLSQFSEGDSRDLIFNFEFYEPGSTRALRYFL